MDIYFGLVLIHVIGTILGVGGATFIEVHLHRSLRDGTMTLEEKGTMGVDFIVTRIGMILTLVSGIGFVVLYATHEQLARLANGVFWAKMAVFLIIVTNAYLLHKHKIGLYWGSAFSFVSWWAVFLMGMFLTNGIKFFAQNPLLSFFVIITVYAVFVVVGAALLNHLRNQSKIPPTQPPAVTS